MLSFIRALGLIPLLVIFPSASVAATGTTTQLGESQVTISFGTGPEHLYFSGDGSVKTAPLIGILVNYLAGVGVGAPIDANAQANLNILFEFTNSNVGANARCCFPYASCTPDSVNQFTIPTSAQTTLLPNVPTQLKCTGGNAAFTWVELLTVSTTSPQIQGQLNWLADGPSAKSGVNYVTAPILSNLVINANALTGASVTNAGITTPAANPDGPTVWLQAVDAVTGTVAPSQNGVNDGTLVDAGTGYINWSTTNSTSTQYSDKTNLLDVIGCSYQPPGSTQWVTVNDNTHWIAPTAAGTRNDYFPTCYFKGVSTPTGTLDEAVTVQVQLQIGVLAPCQNASSVLYNATDIGATILNYYQVKGTVTPGTTIYYHDSANSKTAINGIKQLPTILPTSADPVQFPFYSMLEVASINEGAQGVMLDPIGYYLSIKAGQGVPAYITGTNNGIGSQGVVSPSLVPAAQQVDQNHPFLCFSTNQKYMNPDGSFPASTPTTLVNDLTLWPIGNTYVINCYVWDLKGIKNQCTLLLPIGKFVDTSVVGDPQFTGFLGQSYQIHGVSGHVYNILSTPTFQYNALFNFLSSGSCRSGTQCFSHPGNYFGEVGMLFKGQDGVITAVRVVAGPVKEGLTVYVNDELVAVNSESFKVADATLTFSDPFELEVEGNEFFLRLSNSDMFINQDVAIHTPLLHQIHHYRHQSKVEKDAQVLADLRAKLPHGLLGQTWEDKKYPNRWVYIQGTLFDYSVADGVTGVDFKYNRF